MARRRGPHKDVADLMEWAESQGLVVHPPNRSLHYVVRWPDGRWVASLPGTPSDHRSIKNCRAAIRRALRAEAAELRGSDLSSML